MTDFLDSLTHGLKTDNFVADFLCNDIRLAGIISSGKYRGDAIRLVQWPLRHQIKIYGGILTIS
ncbi:hypothetical protein [Lysinibacillus xylanilyticus]|uniref:hypothetical protein n=1 Tax=Lysinibacillus xylanilyticus TaxID=582475 RepID=UPI003D01CA1D